MDIVQITPYIVGIAIMHAWFILCVCVCQPTPEPENVNLSSSLSKPKGGRRRWGYVTGVLKGEDWDDYEDTDTTTTTLNKPAFICNEKQLQGDSDVNR